MKIEQKIFKIILYLGLLFLFLALLIVFGIIANKIHILIINYYNNGEVVPNYFQSFFAVFILGDIFAILLLIYWIVKIILCFQKKDKINNIQFEIILYLGLFFLFLALSILFGIYANSLFGIWCTIFVFADIFAIILSIYWIIKSIFCLYNNEIYINQLKIILYFGLFFLFWALALWFGALSTTLYGIWRINLIFIDFFAILLAICWLTKSIFCLYDNIIWKDKVDKKQIQQTKQINQIRKISMAISIYRKKCLNYAEIFIKVEAYNKGFKTEEAFKAAYLAFVNEEAISNAKWESVLEFELEHQE